MLHTHHRRSSLRPPPHALVSYHSCYKFRCAVIPSPYVKRLFGNQYSDQYYEWLPGAASHFYSHLTSLFDSANRLRLRSEVLATQPAPLFRVDSGGDITTNVPLTGSVDGELITKDTVVYAAPYHNSEVLFSALFVPSELMYDQNVVANLRPWILRHRSGESFTRVN